jgi:hypothetical protein
VASRVAVAREQTRMCHIGKRAFRIKRSCTVYWTDKKKPGTLVLTDIYTTVEGPICPNTNRKIKYTRELQQSGSSFANSEQTVQQAIPTDHY